jgi:hypothetical protein
MRGQRCAAVRRPLLDQHGGRDLPEIRARRVHVAFLWMPVAWSKEGGRSG